MPKYMSSQTRITRKFACGSLRHFACRLSHQFVDLFRRRALDYVEQSSSRALDYSRQKEALAVQEHGQGHDQGSQNQRHGQAPGQQPRGAGGGTEDSHELNPGVDQKLNATTHTTTGAIDNGGTGNALPSLSANGCDGTSGWGGSGGGSGGDSGGVQVGPPPTPPREPPTGSAS